MSWEDWQCPCPECNGAPRGPRFTDEREDSDPDPHLFGEVPVAGCDCGDCAYARWFDALSPTERALELEAIYAYTPEDM